jgi:hypothetical protein
MKRRTGSDRRHYEHGRSCFKLAPICFAWLWYLFSVLLSLLQLCILTGVLFHPCRPNTGFAFRISLGPNAHQTCIWSERSLLRLCTIQACALAGESYGQKQAKHSRSLLTHLFLKGTLLNNDFRKHSNRLK